MKVLITGGMGVIGAETSRKFVREGHRPVVFARHRDESLIGDISGRRTDSIYVAVNDPDTLHAKAKAAGARIEMELHNTDYGSRDFACRDPEGNLWSFGTYWPKVSEKPLEG